MTRKIRPIRTEGNVAFVTLTRGYVATIDAADAAEVEMWNWCAMVRPHTVYAVRGMRIGGKSMTIRMHRQIVAPPPEMQVDHINGDGLDCRRGNMRMATNAQNQHNQRTRSDNTSGVKCVYWHKSRCEWRARIWLEGKKRDLGRFDTIEAAAAAAAVARAALHGEFGRDA